MPDILSVSLQNFLYCRKSDLRAVQIRNKNVNILALQQEETCVTNDRSRRRAVICSFIGNSTRAFLERTDFMKV